MAGGAGYIGSHVALTLLEAGYDVAIADNFRNSSRAVGDVLRDLSGGPLELHEADLRDASRTAKLFEEPFDGVIHLAGLKAVGESMVDPGLYYRTNLAITLNLLDSMRASGSEALVFSSSATVYGAENPSPYSELQAVGRAIASPYGRTKAMAEEIIRDYGTYESSPVRSLSLRYFNPIGAHPSGLLGEHPRGTPNNLMPHLLRAASTGKPLAIFGDDYPTADGTCERDYVHVMDVAEAHLDALEWLLEGHSANGDGLLPAYNIGTGKPTSVLELIGSFEAATGVGVPREFAPRRSGDLPSFFADVSLAREQLNWSAHRSIADACRDAWNYQRALSADGVGG